MTRPRSRPDPRLPEELWRRLLERAGGGGHVVSVRLTDGTVLRDVAVDERGSILGVVVGGHDGVRPLDPPLAADRVEAVRLDEGLLGRLGLTGWVRRAPDA